jgi:hypothetical protein
VIPPSELGLKYGLGILDQPVAIDLDHVGLHADV